MTLLSYVFFFRPSFSSMTVSTAKKVDLSLLVYLTARAVQWFFFFFPAPLSSFLSLPYGTLRHVTILPQGTFSIHGLSFFDGLLSV